MMMRLHATLIFAWLICADHGVQASNKDEEKGGGGSVFTPILGKLKNAFKISTTTASATTASSPPPQAIALDLATGNWKAQATRAFVQSGMAAAMETLCQDGKFAKAAQIAEVADLKPEPTYRLLRYLSTLGVAVEGDDRDFTLGPVGEVLTPNHPQSVAKAVLWEAHMTSARVWDQLTSFLQTDEAAGPKALGADSIWSFLAGNPDILALFSQAMTGYSNEAAFVLKSPELSPTFDLSAHATICDLGCAEGRLALGLNQRFPNAKYILADLPETLARLDASQLPSNFQLQETNFLTQTAPKADAYVLKNILHDWDDAECGVILRNIHQSNPKASVFVIEFGPMPGPNIPHGFDLHMAVLFHAAERTQEEYDALWRTNGYQRVATHLLVNGDYHLYVQELKWTVNASAEF